ncbi:MAG: PTS glucose transporter subunit IIA [Alicyclobacillus sp.]|nr:PTS glucose transporter subunit IIA [Alicyclobacillus sp.]
MLKNLFKRGADASVAAKAELTICAPLSGRIVPIGEVEDPVFAQCMVGDGIAVVPASDCVVAPVSGTLTHLFPTGHAAGITTPEGLEVLVHVGLDTVELKGEGFTLLAQQGQQVERGTPLIQLDLPRLQQTARSLQTPVIITNMDKVDHLEKAAGEVAAGDWVMKVRMKQGD